MISPSIIEPGDSRAQIALPQRTDFYSSFTNSSNHQVGIFVPGDRFELTDGSQERIPASGLGVRSHKVKAIPIRFSLA